MENNLSELAVLADLLKGSARLAQAAVDLEGYKNINDVSDQTKSIMKTSHDIMIKAEKAMNDYFNSRDN